MAQPLRFGVTLPQIKRSWAETSACAREVDALGFDSVWVCDHVYGVPLPNLPILEAWSLLANILTPLLVGAMFVLEYAVRLRALPNWEQVGILGSVRAFSRHFGQPAAR